MRTRDVPQDDELFDGRRGVCYATDEDGTYSLVPTTGWEPANIANRQAWQAINSELAEVRRKVSDGELSPLAYHMHSNLMDLKLLARYVRLPRWIVRRHMKPEVFAKLKPAIIERYAEVFAVTSREVRTVPPETR